MFSPPLYTVRKYPLRLILNQRRVLYAVDEERYYIKQQDNPLFRQIRLITGVYDRHNPYIIFVDCKGCDSNTEGFEDLLREGFKVGQQHFVLCERSASMTRNAILSFVDETINAELNERVSMGLTDVETVLSKWYAYRGLMLSSCHCIEGWVPKIVVVPDYYKTIKDQRIKYIYDKENRFIDKDGKERVGTQKDVAEDVRDIEINVFDGCGIHHPSITREVQMRLGSNTVPTSMLIRLPFIKGMTHEVDYPAFFAERGVTEIRDVWGHKHSVLPDAEPMLIMFESMYKGLKYFKQHGDYRDWEDYWRRFKQYEHCFGVAKWNYSKDEETIYTRANYQILQDLDLPYQDFAKLAKDSVDWIDRISGGDLAYVMCFLGMHADKHNALNDYVRAVLRNQEMLKEPTVRKYIISLIQKYLDDTKCGKIYLKSTFKIAVPDLVMALEHIGGLEPVGCLEADEFYSNDLYGDILGERAVERNPHICRSEHVVLRGITSPVIQRYCSQLSNICMLNGKSLTPQRLNGADYDGDLILVIDNAIFLEGIDRSAFIVIDVDDKVTVTAERDNIENKIKAIMRSMKNLIGEFSNYASAYHNKTPKSVEQKQKYEHYIDIISVLTGKSIGSSVAYASNGIVQSS